MDSRTRPTPRLAVLGVAVLAALLAAAPARAGLITPDSIPQPPPMVGAADGTAVLSPACVVWDQYAGLGIQFFGGREYASIGNNYPLITRLGGTDVWIPAIQSGRASEAAEVVYGGWVAVRFAGADPEAAPTAGSVTVTVFNPSLVPLALHAYDWEGQRLAATTGNDVGRQGVESLTVSAPDIGWFAVDYVGPRDLPSDAPWGVAGIAFTPSAPEPCGLALAVAGITAAAGGALRRRVVTRP